MVQIGNVTLTNKLGLGTNKVGGHNLFKNLQDEDGHQLVETALNQGITLLDTAFAYGYGRSEEIIGDVIQRYKREDIIIATKAAHDPARDYAFNNDPAFLTQSVEDALRRLKTDYIDIFYIHFPDETTDKRAAVAALQKLKEAGKIRAIGLSNFSLEQIKIANADGYVDIVEDAYSLVEREAETITWEYLSKHGIGFVPYFPLASGLLTGKYTADQTFGPDDWQFNRPNFQSPRYEEILAGVEVLREVGRRYEATPGQIALAWYMKHPKISAVIPGARVAEQVLDNAKAASIHLSESDFELIDQAFKK